MSRVIDLTNQRFGKLIAMSMHSADSYGRKKWLCLCDCGNSSIVSSDNLRRGHTLSCGCVKAKRAAEASITHGHTSIMVSPEYRAWVHMKTRCYNVNASNYYLYGGRGIKVCDRWFNSFENFFADMGMRPSAEHSLDRYPNVNGDYELSNCRWATKIEQARNKRNNRIINYNGKMIPIWELSDIVGSNDGVIRNRINRGQCVDINASVKMVVDLQTGIFYDSIKEAANAKQISYGCLLHKLKGRVKNNTSIVYV